MNFSRMADFVSNHPFLSGAACGFLAAFLLLFLIWLILFRLRPHKISKLGYRTEKGEISIHARAIADLVRALEGEFKEFSIADCVLLQWKGECFLRVRVDYNDKARPFPEAAAAFQARVLSKLETSYGIRSVKRVEVIMKNKL